ncbi:MAG: LEA type 2 family protein [Gemmatimonadota bacterium]
MKRSMAGRGVRRTIVALLVVGMAACLPRLERPEVRLVSVRVTSLGLTGGNIRVRLNVYNPNGFALDAAGLTYDVELAEDSSGDDWMNLAQGTYDQAVRVGANDSAQVEIPVSFSYSGLSGAFRALIQRGAFDYRIHGSVNLETPIRRKIPYRHRGAVSMGGAS